MGMMRKLFWLGCILLFIAAICIPLRAMHLNYPRDAELNLIFPDAWAEFQFKAFSILTLIGLFIGPFLIGCLAIPVWRGKGTIELYSGGLVYTGKKQSENVVYKWDEIATVSSFFVLYKGVEQYYHVKLLFNDKRRLLVDLPYPKRNRFAHLIFEHTLPDLFERYLEQLETERKIEWSKNLRLDLSGIWVDGRWLSWQQKFRVYYHDLYLRVDVYHEQKKKWRKIKQIYTHKVPNPHVLLKVVEFLKH
jgi:hypothetical protein